MFGQEKDLNIKEPLKSMAINFQIKLPVVISIGVDEVRKTFSYVQLTRLQSWENLLIKINPQNQKKPPENLSLIFPLMQSENLEEFKDRLKQSLSNQDWNEVDWAKFWVKEFSRALGFNQENYQLNELDKYLKQKNSKIIILIDGLENIFPDLAHDNFQQTALKALIDNLPNKLTEIKQSNLGLIVFLHRDSLRKTIKQNSGQFESLYIEYCF